MFTDKGLLRVKAGDGGNGVVSFRQERFVDRGGPDGGDGGDGGDIVFVGDRNLNTLRSFRHSQLIKAQDGAPGFKAKRHGKNGKDLYVKVPIGTVLFRDDELLGDIVEDKQELTIAYGGSGGFGNAHFKSSRRQAPRVAENGEPGDEFEVKLELKLLADVGLVGLPNAGKSTFLSVVTNARPEIADYPFTTLVPNLGVADVDSDSLLIADIPGLIAGASQGKGLGDEFLRHIERTGVLLHLIDCYSKDLEADFKTIRTELKDYKIDLTDRPIITVLTKAEGLDDELVNEQIALLKPLVGKGQPIYVISSAAKLGLKDVLQDALRQVKQVRATKAAEAEEANDTVVYTLEERPEDWFVEDLGKNQYKVTGAKIERFARRTNYENEWGVNRLKDILHKMGILRDLDRKGMQPGATVYFGERQEWQITI